MIIDAIESGGNAKIGEFDLDKIVERNFEYSTELQAFVQLTSTDEFWSTAEEAAL